jgi:hypothetical protein
MACEVSEHDTGERNRFTKTKVQGVKGLYPPRVAALARPRVTVAAPHPLELVVLLRIHLCVRWNGPKHTSLSWYKDQRPAEYI